MNKPKIAGTKWETDNARYLSRWWPKIKRAALEGNGDVGDLNQPEGWAVECKTAKTINLPQFLREAEEEASNNGVLRFVAIIKNRRSKGESGQVEDGYAVTRTRIWAQVAREHEIATEGIAALSALAARWHSGRVRDSMFASLAHETLRIAANDLEDVAAGE